MTDHAPAAGRRREITLEIMGSRVPALGFGTWQLTGHDCERGVAHAIELGYRHVDTAQMYENEDRVGRGLADSGVARDEVFLVTKVAPGNLEPATLRRTTERSVRDLRTDFVDLLLVHWPTDDVPLQRTLEAMNGLRERGLVRHVGVSNFTPRHLAVARQHAAIFCNQVEYHPFLAQDHLVRDAREHGMLLTAYCPLARGRVLDDDTIGRIAGRHERTPAQIALRWLLQQGVAAIPKAASAAHRAENLEALEFELSEADMDAISSLRGEHRLIDPEWAPAWEREHAQAG